MSVNHDEEELPLVKASRIRSIRIAQIAAFVFALGFSVMIAGVFPYLREVSLLEFKHDL